MFDIAMTIAGIAASWILFFRFPFLKNVTSVKGDKLGNVSVIIPVRNEQENIGRLLDDLLGQSVKAKQIICVNDGSTDQSAAIISGHPVTLIDVDNKPEGWIGKSYACYLGANHAKEDLLLFVDSDVRLESNALEKLLEAYNEHGLPVSILPCHLMEKPFEQMSIFFNLVQVAANGAALVIDGQQAGLYGPVIMIDRATYDKIGTHEAIKGSIVDDVALGSRLKSKGYSFRLYLGKGVISYRMYSSLRSLFQGWIKNYATGAQYAPALVALLTFLWVASLLTTSLGLAKMVIGGFAEVSCFFILAYLVWIGELFRISPKIGNFKTSTIILFPGYVAVFVVVFLISGFKKIFRLPVVWKGRKVRVVK